MKATETHYQTSKHFDVIDFCYEYSLNFNKGNVIKYIARAGRKEGEPELKDLYKALDYLKREIEYLQQEVKVC